MKNLIKEGRELTESFTKKLNEATVKYNEDKLAKLHDTYLKYLIDEITRNPSQYALKGDTGSDAIERYAQNTIAKMIDSLRSRGVYSINSPSSSKALAKTCKSLGIRPTVSALHDFLTESFTKKLNENGNDDAKALKLMQTIAKQRMRFSTAAPVGYGYTMFEPDASWIRHGYLVWISHDIPEISIHTELTNNEIRIEVKNDEGYENEEYSKRVPFKMTGKTDVDAKKYLQIVANHVKNNKGIFLDSHDTKSWS